MYLIMTDDLVWFSMIGGDDTDNTNPSPFNAVQTHPVIS